MAIRQEDAAGRGPLAHALQRAWRGQDVQHHIVHGEAVVRQFDRRRRHVRYLAKAELFDKPGLGQLLRAAHQIPVQRGRVEAADALQKAVDALRRKLQAVNPSMKRADFALARAFVDNLSDAVEPMRYPIVERVLAMSPRPRVIWMQLGIRNDAAAALAEAAGLKVVMNRCPKIEYGRLSSEISWMGVNSRTLTSKRAKMLPGGIQRLREVAVPVHERDGDHGQLEVGRGAKGVARENAESAAVGGDRLLEADLHGEIGDAAGGEIGTSSGERVGKAQVVFPFLIRTSAGRPGPGARLTLTIGGVAENTTSGDGRIVTPNSG